MSHPSSLDLESHACGESLREELRAHIEQCSACLAFVAELRALVSAGPSVAAAEAAVARALEGVATELPAEVEAPQEVLAPVIPLGARARERAGERAASKPDARGAKRRLWMITTSVVTPLAAAAAILFLLRSTPPETSLPPLAPSAGPASPAQPAPPDTIQMGALPSASDPDTRFKGGMQVAVVRERAGKQARFSSAVPVKPGDRIRVEVALDREQAIVGAVLGDDGSYLELMPEAVRGAGTYFSERSARIDASPTSGTIVIGSPDAVARARATRHPDGSPEAHGSDDLRDLRALRNLRTLRVEWEQP